ncbi:hypothetical protein DOTSEDRAFT_41929 [Dothistroma septosporum NZE10]|uniref:BRCT domain-containing protein n=1 Tax=Dothistroma septosporum (strain NZE10 / CBS 128990) TaxID=675120 RepID=N1PVN3_DOTSN|nr:hypothetical protein DOTSEDRAFT_41929 [Dothistroma septosporum NZE10]
MAPPRSVFIVTRRNSKDTADAEGHLKILEAFATREAAQAAAEAHAEEKSAEAAQEALKFEVTELPVKEGEAEGDEGAAVSKSKTKKPAPAKRGESEKKAIPKGKANALQGLKMIFTGTFKSMDRKTCEATAKVYGADIVSDKKLAEADLIVVGERPGPKKVVEIKEKSLKSINEAEFLEMVETGDADGDENEEEEEAEEGPAQAKKAAPKRPAPKPNSADKKSASTAIEGTPGSLNGLDLLFTGTMTANRADMEKAAVASGAKVVKKLEDTDYVILGVKPGPKKLKEIEEKKPKTITEAEFLEMLGAEPPSKKQKV